MRVEVDIQLDFYCDVCGNPMCDNISYGKQRAILKIEPCEKCLEEAREEAREEALQEAREE